MITKLKTFTAITAIKAVKKKYPNLRVLVVVPTTTLKDQWFEELNGQLQTENGEVCDDNPVLSSEIKESEPMQSVEVEPDKSE